MHGASGAKSLLESSFKTYSNQTQNKLVSGLKHAANTQHFAKGMQFSYSAHTTVHIIFQKKQIICACTEVS